MNNKVIFGFSESLVSSALVGDLIQHFDECYLLQSADSVVDFVHNMKNEFKGTAHKTVPDSLILGIGEYSGKDQSKIRIEQVAYNKFRNETINKEIKSDHFYQLYDPLKMVESTDI